MDPKILSRIQKCLRLAASDNPHEAAAALRQAQALMREHGVSSEDVTLADVGEQSQRASSAGNLPRWHAFLINVISETYGVANICRIGWKGTRVVFIGTGGAEQVAGYAYAVLLRQATRSRSEYYKRLRGKRSNRIARADQYAEGWVYAVSEVLEARKTPVPALVDRYKRQQYSNTTTGKAIEREAKGRRGLDDANAGYDDGRKAQLHDGLEGSNDIKRLPND